MRRETARGLRPRTHVLDDPARGIHWRGGQVWSIAGDTCTIRVRIESCMTRDFTGPLADLPSDRVTVGAPLVLRVIGAGAQTYTIAEIRSSVFADPRTVGTDEVGSVARGEFNPGVITPAEGADWSPYDH